MNKFRPQIVQRATEALGRSVDIGPLKLNIAFSQGLTLDIKNLEIADDKAFSNENFLNIDEIRLGVDIESLIFKKQIRVLSVDLISPKIVIIRNASTLINVQTVFPAKSPGSKQQNSATKPAQAVSGNTSADAKELLSSLTVNSAKIRNGQLVFIDKTFNPPIRLEISDLNLTIDNFSLNKPTDFLLEASVFSPQKNIEMKGQLEVDPANYTFRIRKASANSDLSYISLAELKESLPMMAELALKENLQGQLAMDIHELLINQKGFSSLSADGTLKNANIVLSQAPFPLENINAAFHCENTDIDILELSMPLSSGKISGKGQIKDYLKGQNFNFSLAFDNVDLSQMIPPGEESVEIQGKLFGKYAITGQGFSGPSFLSSLSGNGDLKTKDAKLININVFKLVMSKISMIPGLVEDLEQNLPEKYKQKLQGKDTDLPTVELATSLAGKSLVIDEANIATDTFSLTGQGNVGFDQALSLTAQFRIPADLSKSMIERSQGLGYLSEDTGEIVFPLKVSGKIPNLAFYPDVEYLGKKIFTQRGKDALQQVLEKALGVEDSQAPAEPGQETAPAQEGAGQEVPAQAPTRTPEQELIGTVLNAIFQ